MGLPVLILGESGTGKSASMRNFKKGELALVNVAGKPLPFKGKFDSIQSEDYREIKKFMQSTKAKTIVVDDAQYIMAFGYMRRIKENGWDKFNEIQSDFFNLIDLTKELPDDVLVYFLSHLETKDDGRQKIKTIGKMLDEKITVEGMFTTVLKTYVSDGKYFFTTQNSGMDTVKSPMGMFPASVIDNDLKYVDEKIRNYYEIGEHLSDKEMEEKDQEAAQPDVNPGEKKNRRRRKKKTEEKDTDEKPKSREEVQGENSEKIANHGVDDEGGEVPFDEAPEPPKAEKPPRRRRRTRKED
ncbi:AAA family ATPase [Anaerostipes hominis (ex Lee et al. 2021)]|uniref:AAA family ATPase n=1 Tax=Anaerostipes hominis (ex Lee et al. 2021) TaxID=2025494 RepID=UPI0022E59CCD|nr:AAA family ATPase [Anaerostipes hominis (ex Lee et al. 2021)]